MLKYVHENDCSWEEDTCYPAEKGGDCHFRMGSVRATVAPISPDTVLSFFTNLASGPVGLDLWVAIDPSGTDRFRLGSFTPRDAWRLVANAK